MKKQAIWDAEKVIVDSITDRLGMPIDSGIKETVIVLRLLGFKTSQSCEGHSDRALPFPWVMIDCDERSQSVTGAADIRMAEYLEEFYQTHTAAKWARLSMRHFKDGFRLASYIGRAAKKFRESGMLHEYEVMQKNCQREMWHFTDFLKGKFFGVGIPEELAIAFAPTLPEDWHPDVSIF